MHRTKLAILASTSLCMGLGFAQAADMVVKAPVLKAPIVDPWVGVYAGGNVGYSWGRFDTTTSVAPFTALVPFFVDFPGGASSTALKPDGVVGGVQIGLIGRIAPNWLGGFEADFQWTGQKDSGRGVFGGDIPTCTAIDCSFTNITDITAKLSWFGTLRGRVGIEGNGLWFYATGGLAYGKVSVSGINALILPEGDGTLSTPFSNSRTKAGYTVGVGIEGLIGTGDLRWKLEYLHIDLGSLGTASFGSVPIVTVNGGRFTDEILRFGVNYRFASAP